MFFVFCINLGYCYDCVVKLYVWYYRNMLLNGIILDIIMIVIKYNGYKI